MKRSAISGSVIPRGTSFLMTSTRSTVAPRLSFPKYRLRKSPLGHVLCFVNVPVTYTFSESFKVNLNAGWIYERPNDQHFVSYGAGFEWIPLKHLTLIGEVFGVVTQNPEARTVVDPRFQLGLRITPIDTMDFDVIYGRNIGGENANWITVGLNVRFPAPKK